MKDRATAKCSTEGNITQNTFNAGVLGSSPKRVTERETLRWSVSLSVTGRRRSHRLPYRGLCPQTPARHLARFTSAAIGLRLVCRSCRGTFLGNWRRFQAATGPKCAVESCRDEHQSTINQQTKRASSINRQSRPDKKRRRPKGTSPFAYVQVGG